MCSQYLIELYKTFLMRTGLRSRFVEQWVALDPTFSSASPVEAPEDDAPHTYVCAGEVPGAHGERGSGIRAGQQR